MESKRAIHAILDLKRKKRRLYDTYQLSELDIK
jgi:hypothetical protein